MTLFAAVSEPDLIFSQVIEKYFSGHRDIKTLDILKDLNEARRDCP